MPPAAFRRPGLSRSKRRASLFATTTDRSSPTSTSRPRPAGDRRQSLWGLSRRTRAIDHLLYEINSGFWRWVTGGRGNVLSIGVVVIASTRPPPNRLLGLGQPSALTSPHTREFGSPYRVRFGPFLFPVEQPPSCSPKMRRGRLLPILRSCRSYLAKVDSGYTPRATAEGEKVVQATSLHSWLLLTSPCRL